MSPGGIPSSATFKATAGLATVLSPTTEATTTMPATTSQRTANRRRVGPGPWWPSALRNALTHCGAIQNQARLTREVAHDADVPRRAPLLRVDINLQSPQADDIPHASTSITNAAGKPSKDDVDRRNSYGQRDDKGDQNHGHDHGHDHGRKLRRSAVVARGFGAESLQ
jgi:hypothetical protein